jgi:two-component system, NtrC family, nitrogen regulation response regulator NtrX
MNMANGHVVVVEDDPDTLEMLTMLLEMSGYRVDLFQHGRTAFDGIRAVRPDVVILDLWLEHRKAGEVVLGLLSLDPVTQTIPVIICSAHIPQIRDYVSELRRRGHTVVEKPFEAHLLLAHVAKAVAYSQGNRTS